jgi:hypothetical protein
MATDEELIEAIKRPDRYYHITIGGYGGETSYARITEAAYNYWNDQETSELESYMSGPESYVEEDNPDLPAEANFLYNAEEEYYQDWYDPPNELLHGWGVDIDNSWISIEERDSEEYNSKHLAEIVDTVDTPVYIKDNNIEKVDAPHALDLDFLLYPHGHYEEDESDEHEEGEPKPLEDGTVPEPYVFYGMSAEKGTFFDGVVHLDDGSKFDPTKLTIFVEAQPNGDTIISKVTYNGWTIDNNGGDTTGKGYYASVWDW